MKHHHRLGATVALVAAIGLGGVVAAPAASAAVSCGRIGADSSGASVSCTGSGQFRLVYQCKRILNYQTGAATYATTTSSWKKAPLSTWVSASCPSRQYTAWVERR